MLPYHGVTRCDVTSYSSRDLGSIDLRIDTSPACLTEDLKGCAMKITMIGQFITRDIRIRCRPDSGSVNFDHAFSSRSEPDTVCSPDHQAVHGRLAAINHTAINHTQWPETR
jgi:hypothetical protein